MNELSTLISLALLAGVIFWLYNTYRIDLFRQDIFAIRDELFDEARAGRIAFDSTAYRATRILMNGVLRFGHETSLFNMIMTRVLVGRPALAESGRLFRELVSRDSEADAELCRKYLDRIHRRAIQHMLMSPVAMVTIVVPLYVFAAALVGRDAAMDLARKLKAQLSELDGRAFQRGDDRAAIGSQTFC